METNIFKLSSSFCFSSARIVFLLLFFHLLLAAPAVSQDVQDGKNYFVQQGLDDNSIIFQTLEWTQGRHIEWYEVTLETFDESTNTWVPENNAIPELGKQLDTLPEDIPEFLGDGVYKTENNKLSVSLAANESGALKKYRYTVTSYNLLGHKAFTTDYVEFEIRKAYIPEVQSISTELIYLDTIYDPTIRISGENLRDNTDYYLINEREVIYPIEIIPDDNERRAEIVFDPKNFDVGEWALTAENPGGFTASQPLTIKFMKWYDVSLSAGYSPLVILLDDNIKKFFPSNFMPMGADARATFIFLKRRGGYMGASLNAKWNSILNEDVTHNINSHLIHGFAALVYRFPIIRNRLTLEARVGGGITYVQGLKFEFEHDLASEPFNSIFPAITAGVSLSGNFWRGGYIEAGADIMASFSPEMFILSVAPVVSVGWTL